MDEAKIKSIVEAIGLLDPEKDFTQSGVPEVRVLEASVTAQERDAAWEQHQSSQESPELETPQSELTSFCAFLTTILQGLQTPMTAWELNPCLLEVQ